jgi:hypothetical protein
VRDRRPAVVGAAAGLAAVYALASLLLGGFMAWSWLRGRPITSPLQIIDPALTFLVPGEEIEAPFGGSSLAVTDGIVRAVASLYLVFFLIAGAAWGLTAAGLRAGKAWARVTAIVLFLATALTGLSNLSVEIALVALLGADAGVGGRSGVVASILFTLVVLLLLPGAGAAALLRPAVAPSFRRGPAGAVARHSPLAVSLTVHFFLVGALLVVAVLLPDVGASHRILVGPWLLAGSPARLVSAALAAGHLAAGIGFARLRRWGYELGLWMNMALTALAMLSATLSTDPALASLTGGLLPAAATRWTIVALCVLSAGLVFSVRLTRARFTSAPRPVAPA